MSMILLETLIRRLMRQNELTKQGPVGEVMLLMKR